VDERERAGERNLKNIDEALMELIGLNIGCFDIAVTLLLWICNYCGRRNIPIWREPDLKKFTTHLMAVLQEIDEKSSKLLETVRFRKFIDRENEDLSSEEFTETAYKIKYLRSFIAIRSESA
jgi:hypothetical protein